MTGTTFYLVDICCDTHIVLQTYVWLENCSHFCLMSEAVMTPLEMFNVWMLIID